MCVALFTLAPPAQADWWSLFRWFHPTTTTTTTPSHPPATNWLLCLLGGCPSTPSPTNWLLCLLGGCPQPTTTTSATTTTTSTTTTTTTTTIPTTTTTPPTTSCDTLPKPGGGTWECSFNDEFSGTALDRDQVDAAAHGRRTRFDQGPECFVDDPDNISVDGGALKLTVRKEAAPFTCAEPARATQLHERHGVDPPRPGVGFAQTYGRYEIRAKVTGAKVTGLHEAFWTVARQRRSASWPSSGEIDIAEIYHQYPDRAIPYVHYNNWLDPNVTNNYCMIDDIAEFHTYVLEWTPQRHQDQLRRRDVCIDDPWQPWLPQTGRQPFDQPFYLVLTQALGIGGQRLRPGHHPAAGQHRHRLRAHLEVGARVKRRWSRTSSRLDPSRERGRARRRGAPGKPNGRGGSAGARTARGRAAARRAAGRCPSGGGPTRA